MVFRNIISFIFFICCITSSKVIPMDIAPDKAVGLIQQNSSSSSSSSSSQFSFNNTSKQKDTLPLLKQFQKLKQHRDRFTEANFFEETEIVHKELTATINSNTLIDLINQYVKLTQIFLNKEIKENNLKENEFYVQKKILKGTNEYFNAGDIHGSLHSLMLILQDLYNNDYLDENLKLKDNFFIIFTGDYTDRGLYGAEVWYLLLTLKLTEGNWEKVFLLRGNHEAYIVNKTNDPTELNFYTELKIKYKNEYKALIKAYKKLYNYLLQALFINNYSPKSQENNWMMFCHGGLDQSNEIAKFLAQNNSIQVKVLHSNCPFLTGFLWYDVIEDNFDASKRDCNELKPLPLKSLQELGIKILCRGHQHFGDGLRLGDNPDDNEHSSAIPDKNKIKPIRIASVKPCIFTFTTATEFDISTDVFYGIIRTSDDFDQWLLIPHLLRRYQQK